MKNFNKIEQFFFSLNFLHNYFSMMLIDFLYVVTHPLRDYYFNFLLNYFNYNRISNARMKHSSIFISNKLMHLYDKVYSEILLWRIIWSKWFLMQHFAYLWIIHKCWINIRFNRLNSRVLWKLLRLYLLWRALVW